MRTTRVLRLISSSSRSSIVVLFKFIADDALHAGRPALLRAPEDVLSMAGTLPVGHARVPTVLSATGLRRSTVYRLIAAGSFPAPVHLGPRAVGWRWSDLDQWTRSRPSTH
jgi:prophage regulatory protein